MFADLIEDLEAVESVPFASIEVVIEELKGGRMIVVVDDENRESEGDGHHGRGNDLSGSH